MSTVDQFVDFQAELNCLSRIAATLQSEDTMFERLDVDASLALQMFEDNR